MIETTLSVNSSVIFILLFVTIYFHFYFLNPFLVIIVMMVAMIGNDSDLNKITIIIINYAHAILKS